MNQISETEKAEIEAVIHDSIGWALTKDFERLYSIMAQEADFFIFHPDSKSTIHGFEAFKDFDFVGAVVLAPGRRPRAAFWRTPPLFCESCF